MFKGHFPSILTLDFFLGGGRWWCSYSNFLRYLVFDLLIPFLPSLRGFNQWQPGKVELRLPEAQTLIEVCQYSVVLLWYTGIFKPKFLPKNVHLHVMPPKTVSKTTKPPATPQRLQKSEKHVQHHKNKEWVLAPKPKQFFFSYAKVLRVEIS